MSHATTTLNLDAVNTKLNPNQKCQAWGITLELFVSLLTHR
ncbi:hypothetical protein [Vibrio gallaecicus]|nr:hypothetical protein [Vibrio gallaecicus]MDN3617245.1 hypothetical protein [Vibrio gallaecicus]MDN3617391.1 hypothetical protein [Vibrio gallaecicus]